MRSPYDGRPVAEVARGGWAELDAAADAAVRAARAMAELPAFERARVLSRATHLIKEHLAELAAAISEEAGKPITLARVEAERCLDTFIEATRIARRPEVEALDLGGYASGAGRLALIRRVPVGPVLAITPFNFPLNLVAHKLAPAIAAGCPVVLKPASQTPGPALLLAAALDQAGLPKGALSVIPSRGADAERAGRRRPHRQADLHRLDGGRLAAQGARLAAPGDARARRQRGGDRRAGRRRPRGDRPPDRRCGLRLRGPVVHLGAARPRPRGDLRQPAAGARGGDPAARHRRPCRRGGGVRAADRRRQRRPGRAVDRRRRGRGRPPARGRRARGLGRPPGAARGGAAPLRHRVGRGLRPGRRARPLRGLRAGPQPGQRLALRAAGRRVHAGHVEDPGGLGAPRGRRHHPRRRPDLARRPDALRRASRARASAARARSGPTAR